MKVLLLGATGMVGQGVLRECLLADDVTDVLVIGRTSLGISHPKLREIVHADMFNIEELSEEFRGYDATFFCIGVSSVAMKAEEYQHLTYDLTLAIAQTIAEVNPQSTFVYVSGSGTDSTENGRPRWARVKGATENAILKLPLTAYMFRPGMIEPKHGIRSNTRFYSAIFFVMTPIIAGARRLAPNRVTTTEEVGKAMIAVARSGFEKRVLEAADIIRLGREPA